MTHLVPGFGDLELVLGLLFAASAGLFCGLDARRRGRSGVGWFLVGFFGGLVGVVAWLIVRGGRSRSPAATARATPEACPQCRSALPPTYGFCPGCGAERAAQDPPRPDGPR